MKYYNYIIMSAKSARNMQKLNENKQTVGSENDKSVLVAKPKRKLVSAKMQPIPIADLPAALGIQLKQTSNEAKQSTRNNKFLAVRKTTSTTNTQDAVTQQNTQSSRSQSRKSSKTQNNRLDRKANSKVTEKTNTKSTALVTTPTTKPAKQSAQTSRTRSAPKTSTRTQTKSTKRQQLVKTKRPYNMKKAPIDYAGIGIGPAKVKKVLMHMAFNPVEHAVRQALKEAEKPSVPKPTSENPNPEQPAQMPVSQLPANFLEVINRAEMDHMNTLRTEYENSYLSKLKETNKERADMYVQARNEAVSKHDESTGMFSLEKFNVSFDSHYYDNFTKFCQENDSYSVDRTDNKKFNQWTRAMALVNKTCTRLSSGVRDVLAAFLDHIVMQYARNGIQNCVNQNLSNLKLRHALLRSGDFNSVVPLDKLVRTFVGYESGHEWLISCQKARDDLREKRENLKKEKVKSESIASTLPDYPDPQYNENFEGYVVEICRSIKTQMAEEQKTAADKAKYLNVKISDDFKKFCSIVVYEAILRVGSHLKETVALKDVKTVNKSLMFHSLRQLCNICGIDFTPIEENMNMRLTKFKSWCEERRKNRGNKTQQATTEQGKTEDTEQVELVDEEQQEDDNDDQDEQVELVDEQDEEQTEEQNDNLTYEDE